MKRSMLRMKQLQSGNSAARLGNKCTALNPHRSFLVSSMAKAQEGPIAANP